MKENKTVYRAPAVELIRFEVDDVLSASGTGDGGGKDENQGEWDPQLVRVFN